MSDSKVDLSKIKTQLAPSKEAVVVETPRDAVVQEDVKYQHYTSSRISMRIVTPIGRVINFVNYKYITANEELISYLDSQIKAGMNSITKGELLTLKEADPMESLKQRIIDEFLAEQAERAKLAPTIPNFGDTKTKQELAASINPATSNDVAG